MVKIKNIGLAILLVVLTACQEDFNKVEPPENLIDEEHMVEILTSVHLVEGARTGLVIAGDKVANVADYYKAIFDKHGVTQSQFDSSFVFYSKDPWVMDKMYEKVIENLSVIESELESD